MKKNILITTVGAPGFDSIFLSIKEWSKEFEIDINVIGVDADQNALGKNFVDVWYQVPRADVDYDGLTKSLKDIISKHDIDLIIPIGDVELEILENLDTRSIISSYGDFKIKNIQDKFYLYKLIQNSNDEALKKLIPDFECSNSFEVVNSFILKHINNDKFLCVKPRFTSGARGVLKLVKDDDLDLEILKKSKLGLIEVGYKKFLKSFATYASTIKDFDYVLCEFLPGSEYSVDLYVQKSVSLAVSRKRAKITSGICTEALIDDPSELKNSALKLAKYLGLVGNVNMQFKQDLHGNFKLLEINPRLSGAVVACKAAGVDFVKLMLSYKFNKLNIDEIDSLKKQVTVAEENRNTMKRTYKEYFFVKDNLIQ
jgi:hypothetical protein